MRGPTALTSMLRHRQRAHIGGATSRAGLILLVFVMVIYFHSQSPNFATVANMLTIMVNVAGTLVAAIAMARLIVAGQIDLSIGGMVALVAVGGAWTARETGSAGLGMVVAVAAGAGLGFINGWLVLRLRISPIIVTLALLGVYSGFAFVITQSRPVSDLPPDFLMLGRTYLGGVPVSVILSVAVFLIGAFALTRSVGGVRSYAIGGASRAAEAMGINVARHIQLLYVYMGASVGIVAVVYVSRLGSASPNLGVGFELDVITAVILGGVGFAGGSGRPIGVFFGVLTIGVLNAGLIFVGISDFWQTIVSSSVLLLALAVDQVNANWRSRVRPQADSGTPAHPPSDQQVPDDDLTSRLRPSIASPGDEVLIARSLAKSFGAVRAVSRVSVTVRAREVTCLLGDNGAGKSTLIKMLAGVVTADGGSVELCGVDVTDRSAIERRQLGIETVYQDLAVCPNLGAAQNLTLGREPRRFGRGSLALFDSSAAAAWAEGRLKALGIVLDDYNRPIEKLSGGQRQCVAIARTAITDVKVVIFDEPTAALGVKQTAMVLRLARRLAENGAAVVIITHDVEAVKLVADRVTVLNMGTVSFDGAAADVSARELVHLMAGFGPESATHNAAHQSEAEMPRRR